MGAPLGQSDHAARWGHAGPLARLATTWWRCRNRKLCKQRIELQRADEILRMAAEGGGLLDVRPDRPAESLPYCKTAQQQPPRREASPQMSIVRRSSLALFLVEACLDHARRARSAGLFWLIVAQNPCPRGVDDVALDFLEAGGVPETAQLTTAAVQCEYEQLDVLCSFPVAFAANMHDRFPLHGTAS